jgi:hypothetical protein
MSKKGKLKKFLKKVAKAALVVAAIVNPALIPMVGNAVLGTVGVTGASAAAVNAAGAFAITTGGNLVAGESLEDSVIAGATSAALVGGTQLLSDAGNLSFGGGSSSAAGVDSASVGAANTTSSYTGVTGGAGTEALTLPAADASMYSIAPASSVSSTGIQASAGEGLDLVASSTTPASAAAANTGFTAGTGMQAPVTSNLTGSTLSQPFLTDMGGGQGLSAPAFGGGTVSEAGVFGAPLGAYDVPKVSLTEAYAINELTKDEEEKKKEEEEKQKEKEALDLTAAFAAIGELFSSRDAGTRGEREYADGGAVLPDKPTATQAPTKETAMTSGMTVAAQQAGATQQAAPTAGVISAEVAAPAAVAEEKIAADQAQAKVVESLTGVKAEQGVLSKEAQAQAATVVPTETAVGREAAAQGTATLVKDVADRTLQAGELVSGAAVDQKQVEAALAKTQAAQGVVSEEMTTQGQLNKLLTNFDAGNPPPWAAASMRGVTAQLAARGLGASSMAGQAIVQATLEAALPIAAADAKVFEQMGLQNLSNRQQTAMVLAEQRAKFLGQEFDQNFQTKVLNAARVADIADKNFTADVTIALENARLTNTMDLQNLSNRQALILAKTAQVAALETANLNNRQQVAVENAKSFLAMDIRNLDNRQQTVLFKAKEIADSIISDTAAANAAKATNATNALEADKINAQLALSASQYNAAEKNKVSIFNKTAADELLKFNAQEANDRAEFNANLATQINIANAKVLADVSTANTREVNAMAAVNAKNATDLSASTYAQLSQTYRDSIEQAWKTSDNNLTRASEITKATMIKDSNKYTADSTADGAFYASMGQLAVALISTGGTSGRSGLDSLYDLFTKIKTPPKQ